MPAELPAKTRIEGFDLARALAIWGMITVHFWIVMAFHQTQPAWLHWCIEMLDGRAAALFVILAGIGISLRSAATRSKTAAGLADGRPEQSADPIAAERRTIMRRGLCLLIVGFLNLTIWKGDILRVYGVSLLVAAFLIDSTDRRVLVASSFFLIGFVVLMTLSDYDVEWEWETFEYHNLWSARGSFKNLFYNGFRSVFPWTGLLLFGVWLGRQQLSDREVRRRALVISVGLAVTAEIVSAFLVRFFRENSGGLDRSTIVALFGTVSMPPLPFFLLAAAAMAVAVIAASLTVAERFSKAFAIRALVACGQMAFTWYVLHIVLGLGGLIVLGLLDNQSLPAAVSSAAAFFILITLISLAVCAGGRRGPLEWLVRKVAG